MKRKTLFLIATLLFCVASNFAQDETFGPLTWKIENGTLTISGTGAMPDAYSYTGPWCNETIDHSGGISILCPFSTIIIKNGVTSIGCSAFSMSGNTSSISIPSTVTSIGGGAFAYSGLRSIVIPSSITHIGGGAFFYCEALTSINVDGENENYSSDDGVLFNKNKTTLIQCPGGKKGSYIIPNSVVNINDCAFDWCLKLTEIYIPNTVSKIGKEAFSTCVKLNSISLPNNLVSIEERTFIECSSLVSIIIPNQVKSIGKFAFSSCKALTYVTCLNPVPPSLDFEVFYGVDIESCTLYVPKSSVDAYKRAPVWQDFKIVGIEVDIDEYDKETDNNGEQLLIYPNPNTGTCSIIIPQEFQNERFLTLSIYDNSGKKVQEISIDNENPEYSLKIDNKAAGVYVAVLSNGKRSVKGRIVFN